MGTVLEDFYEYVLELALGLVELSENREVTETQTVTETCILPQTGQSPATVSAQSPMHSGGIPPKIYLLLRKKKMSVNHESAHCTILSIASSKRCMSLPPQQILLGTVKPRHGAVKFLHKPARIA